MGHPLLYEINTRCWLRELSDRTGSSVTLANVPEEEFATWKRLGFTHIWLMGVWHSGPLARAEALRWPEQRQAYSEALPDWTEEDVAASPYAIAAYQVAPNLGGDAALATFRRKLNAIGIKLLLDLVPNHLGIDHPWIYERPELFVQAPDRLSQSPGLFTRETRDGRRVFAHGKDPNFAVWSDTVQLDYRRPETPKAMLEVLHSIANRCDGVRCDMAMLILPDVFTQTWSAFPALDTQHAIRNTSSSFWKTAIAAVKSRYPEFLFLAEAYWGLEPRLQAEGFDFTYDKDLYDRLVARDAAGTQRHLLKQIVCGQDRLDCETKGLSPSPPREERGRGEEAFVQVPSPTSPIVGRGAHFLENHDERRIASILSPAEHRAAALVILGLPGMRFVHEGQLTGAVRRLPVQLRRRCAEIAMPEVSRIYEELLSVMPQTAIGTGHFRVIQPTEAWAGNPTHENFIIIQWHRDSAAFDLVVVNFAAHQGQCFARLEVPDLATNTWQIQNLLGPDKFSRDGKELASRGLFLDLPALAACIFQFRR